MNAPDGRAPTIVDVSSYQDPRLVDYHGAAAAGVRVAVVRAGEGWRSRDAAAELHVRRARDAGLVVGLYWFCHVLWDRHYLHPRKQLHHLAKRMEELGVSTRPVLDVEQASTRKRAASPWGGSHVPAHFLSEWLEEADTLSRELWGDVPLLYTGPSWWRWVLRDGKHGAPSWPLWLADYNEAPGADGPDQRPRMAPWSWWQYTGTARVPWYAGGPIDLNVHRPGTDPAAVLMLDGGSCGA